MNGTTSLGITAAPGAVSQKRSWMTPAVTFVEETRRCYADLFTQVSRQFQLLKPDTFIPLKRLVDGEEIDLDSAIEAFVDRRASQTMPEKVYMRRNRRERSVAALFLLDMSASTDDVIKDASRWQYTAATGAATACL